MNADMPWSSTSRTMVRESVTVRDDGDPDRVCDRGDLNAGLDSERRMVAHQHGRAIALDGVEIAFSTASWTPSAWVA